MERVIIFDFNRTIYDPDSDKLVAGAKFVLRTLLRRGFKLFLISRAQKSRRELINKLGLDEYFVRVVVTSDKNRGDFERFLSKKTDLSSSFIVGDRVRGEIAIGNKLNLQTVWVRSGKFADELPRSDIENPTYTVKELRDVLGIIR